MYRIIAINIPHIITIFFIFFIGLFMPYLTRKEIIFGVRIPEGLRDHAEVARIKKIYTRNYLLSVGITSLFFIILLLFRTDPIIIFASILVLIALPLGNYYLCHKSLKQTKVDNQWIEGYQETSVVDIRYKPEQTLVSPWWFSIPLGIILIQIILTLNHYESIPEIIPIHYDINGNPDNWARKSYKSVLVLPIINILVTAICFLVYKTIGWSKQQLSVEDPEGSKIRNRIFRKRWSGFVVFINVSGILSSFSMHIHMLNILDFGFSFPLITSGFFLLLILGSATWLSVTTGQGGSRIKLKGESESRKDKMDRDDDKYWKGGIIYFNPEDPSMFVEKRFGVGWTINFGNLKAVLASLAFMILFPATLYLIIYISKS